MAKVRTNAERLAELDKKRNTLIAKDAKAKEMAQLKARMAALRKK